MSEELLTLSRAEAAQRSFIAKVYTWMTAALVVTGLAAMYALSPRGSWRPLSRIGFFCNVLILLIQ